jgi:hypothetical protein
MLMYKILRKTREQRVNGEDIQRSVMSMYILSVDPLLPCLSPKSISQIKAQSLGSLDKDRIKNKNEV